MLKHAETKNSKKLGSATGAVLQYTTDLIAGFFPLVNWNIYESGNRQWLDIVKGIKF